MAAIKRLSPTWIVTCEEHPWFALKTHHEENADTVLSDHNNLFHTEPEEIRVD
jgi:hypothetical protein